MGFSALEEVTGLVIMMWKLIISAEKEISAEKNLIYDNDNPTAMKYIFLKLTAHFEWWEYICICGDNISLTLTK